MKQGLRQPGTVNKSLNRLMSELREIRSNSWRFFLLPLVRINIFVFFTLKYNRDFARSKKCIFKVLLRKQQLQTVG